MATTVHPDTRLPKPWQEKYPEPSTKRPATVTREELLAWIKQGKVPGKDYIVIDVRRTDHTGGFIRGSLNLSIETVYPSLPTLHALSKGTGVKTVVFYCITSRGRGNHAAAWFADYLESKNETDVRSVALFEGIKGWVSAGDEYIEHVDEYNAEVWRTHSGQCG